MEIFKSLKQSPIVQKFEVLDYKRWQSGRYISLKIMLKAGLRIFLADKSFSGVFLNIGTVKQQLELLNL